MATPARLAGVGVFVFLGLSLFAVALFMIGDRQLAFARKVVVYTEFKTITGLQPGAIVRVSGAPAGSVTDIDVPSDPSGRFRARLEITEDLHQLVRTDSVAAIQTEGLVGGSFLAVSTGTAGAPRAPAGSTIPSREPFLLADMFEQVSGTIGKVNATIDSLGAGIEKTLTSVDTTVGSANALIVDVSDDVKTLASASARITSDAAQIAERLRKGEGTFGKLLKDDELYRRATTIAKTAETIAADAQKAVQQARQALDGLNAEGGQITGVTARLGETLEQARTAMAGLSENMEALKRGFFFRGFFNRRGYFSLDDISPEEYPGGRAHEGEPSCVACLAPPRRAVRTFGQGRHRATDRRRSRPARCGPRTEPDAARGQHRDRRRLLGCRVPGGPLCPVPRPRRSGASVSDRTVSPRSRRGRSDAARRRRRG